VEFTATPGGTIYDIMDGGNSVKIIGKPAEGYVGGHELFEAGRIKQCDIIIYISSKYRDKYTCILYAYQVRLYAHVYTHMIVTSI
jgi:hypothetical protein